jgi:hypothetical protein
MVGKPKSNVRPRTWLGVLGAFLCPGAYLLIFGLIISWRDTFYDAHSFSDALVQGAIVFVPCTLGTALLGSVFIIPALLVWYALHRLGWTNPLVFALTGAFVGILVPFVFITFSGSLTPQPEDSAFIHHSRMVMYGVFTLAGIATGMTVWLLAYWHSPVSTRSNAPRASRA